jgi:CheY-like chemotaxis protein
MKDTIIFISYSHRDEAEKDRLVSHLGVLQQAGLVEVWNDDHINAGENWRTEINRAMSQAQVAVLLITANFLNSEFILQTEVPKLLQRRHHENLIIVPIIARACAWRAVGWLQEMNVRPKNGAPVWSGDELDVDEKLSVIVEEIVQLVKANQHSTPTPMQGVNKNMRQPNLSVPWRVLVVEDEPSWQKRLSRILAEINCQVVTISDYEEVETLFDQFDFDLVTVDLNLDKSTQYADGLELAQRIRERFGQRIPIIIITGTGNLEEQRRAFKEYNVFDFIQKERLDLEEFQQAVLEAVGGIRV